MIRCIAAIDERHGLANDKGIPWQLLTDKHYFREKTEGGIVLMGYKTYEEFAQPLPNRRNIVASTSQQTVRQGFELIDDARQFLQQSREDVWVIGGAGLFEQTLDLAEELYLTQVSGDFHCTKFFPEFKDAFRLVSESKPFSENGISFTFQIWRRT